MRNTTKFVTSIFPTLQSAINEDLHDMLVSMQDFADEIEFIRQCLRKLEIDTGHPICYAFWYQYSLQSDAGWLHCSDESEVITEATRILKSI